MSKYDDLFNRQKQERKAAMNNRQGAGSIRDQNRSWYNAPKKRKGEQQPQQPQKPFYHPPAAQTAGLLPQTEDDTPTITPYTGDPRVTTPPDGQTPPSSRPVHNGTPHVPNQQDRMSKMTATQRNDRIRNNGNPRVNTPDPLLNQKSNPIPDYKKTNQQLTDQTAEPKWNKGGETGYNPKTGSIDPLSNRGKSIRGAREGYSPVVESVNGKPRITGWKKKDQVKQEVGQYGTQDNAQGASYAPGFNVHQDARRRALKNMPQTVKNQDGSVAGIGFAERQKRETEAHLNAQQDTKDGVVLPQRQGAAGATGKHGPFGGAGGTSPQNNPFDAPQNIRHKDPNNRPGFRSRPIQPGMNNKTSGNFDLERQKRLAAAGRLPYAVGTKSPYQYKDESDEDYDARGGTGNFGKPEADYAQPGTPAAGGGVQPDDYEVDDGPLPDHELAAADVAAGRTPGAPSFPGASEDPGSRNPQDYPLENPDIEREELLNSNPVGEGVPAQGAQEPFNPVATDSSAVGWNSGGNMTSGQQQDLKAQMMDAEREELLNSNIVGEGVPAQGAQEPFNPVATDSSAVGWNSGGNMTSGQQQDLKAQMMDAEREDMLNSNPVGEGVPDQGAQDLKAQMMDAEREDMLNSNIVGEGAPDQGAQNFAPNNDRGARGRNYAPNQTGRDPREDYFQDDPVEGVPDQGAQDEGYEVDEDITDPDYDDGYGEQVGPAFGEDEEEWYKRRRAENLYRSEAWEQ